MEEKYLIALLKKMSEKDLADGADIYDHPCTVAIRLINEKQALIAELKDFAIWMTGCGYEFTKHKYFKEKRDKLLKTK